MSGVYRSKLKPAGSYKWNLQKRFEFYCSKTDSGCIEWQASVMSNGYGQIRYKGKHYTAHRLAYELYIGKIPDGYFVCHKCDNRKCVNKDHLFIGLAVDNSRDMVSKGRVVRGEKHAYSLLSEKQVLMIRSSAERSKIVGEKFGVSRQAVYGIRSGRNWKHI